MITIALILGEDAVKFHNWTGQIPSEEFVHMNGGQVLEVDFNTEEEYAAYVQALADFDTWHTYAVAEKEVVTHKCPYCIEWKSFFADKERKTYCPDCGALIISKYYDKDCSTKLQFRRKGENEWKDFPKMPTVDNFNIDFPAEFMHGYYSSNNIAWEDDMQKFIDDELSLEEMQERRYDVSTKDEANDEMMRLRQIIINETMQDFFEDLSIGKIEFRHVQVTQ